MISAVGIFGLISISVLITINAASSQLQTMSYVTKFYQNDKNADYMLISSPVYSWIFTYVYKIDFVLSDYYNYIYQTIKPDKILLIADEPFHNDLGNKPLSELSITILKGLKFLNQKKVSILASIHILALIRTMKACMI